MDLARTLLEVEPANKCFANNYYLNYLMHCVDIGIRPKPPVDNPKTDSPFSEYNLSILYETEPSHSLKKAPTLKSKLLFMDYRFNKFNASTLYCSGPNIKEIKTGENQNPIIKFGRESYNDNDINVPGGAQISRRHCLIINSKDDYWLYDLNSTGTYVNGEKVNGKMPLIGKNLIRIGNSEYEVTSDKSQLF
jgi:hypothetical protein